VSLPSGRARRHVLGWMCALIAVNQLGFGGIVPVLALYARSFEVSPSAIGLAVAAYGLARLLVALPAARLADRHGRRAALAVGGLVSAAGNLLCALAPTYPALLAARFVAGAGAGLMLTTGEIVLADISTPADRGRTMATYHGVFLFAVGIGPLPGGWLATHFGFAAPFLAYAVAGALAALVGWLGIPETRDRAGLAGAATGRGAWRAQVRLLARHPGFRLVALVSLTAAFARTGALFTLIPILARDRLALTTDRIGFGLALATLAGLALAYPAGVLTDRHGRKAVIVPATLVSGVALVMFVLAPSYAWFLAACLAWSAGGMGGSAPAAYAADVAPAGMNAAALGTFRMLGDVGYVAGPVLLGLAADVGGPERALGVTAALLAAVALLFAWRAPETHRAARAS
jgi:DHA1 family multidrug resistance protein-like MFS transporter